MKPGVDAEVFIANDSFKQKFDQVHKICKEKISVKMPTDFYMELGDLFNAATID